MPDTKKLYLAEGQSLTLDVDLPYLATETHVDSSSSYAVSLDESGDVITTPENDNFLYDSSGELLFDSNTLLLEAS